MMLLSTANDRAVDVWVVRDVPRLKPVKHLLLKLDIYVLQTQKRLPADSPGMTHGKSLLLPSLVTVAQLFTTINHLVKDLQL